MAETLARSASADTPAKVLFVTFPHGLAGPQLWLRDILANWPADARMELIIWEIEDRYRGVGGKFSLARDARAWVARHSPDAAYVSLDLSAASWVAAAIRAATRAPIIVHSHNSDFGGIRSRWHRAVQQALVRSIADRRVAVGHAAHAAMFGHSSGEWTRLELGIDFNAMHRSAANVPQQPRLPGFVFGLVGRLAPQKNQMLAIEALSLLRQEGINASLLLVGEGDDESRLRAAIDRLGLRDNVGMLPATVNIGSVYAHLVDAIVIPSLFEGQSRIAAEAQSFGLPVVASSGVPDEALLDPARLLRVKGFAAHDWAEVMRKVTPRESTTDWLGIACRHPRLSAEASAIAVVSVLNSAISEAAIKASKRKPPRHSRG